MAEYPKVKSVEVLSGHRLRIVFVSGAVRYYDCNSLLEQPAFHVLRDEGFFRNVHPDAHGYGIVWTDNLDLSESELWINGTTGQAA
ncbi:MAG: DUF2442 domain-containing protein [Deltaproteobacteria bacterium]|nr:DUF2442 domain-containing protein [Deltaproteobacteria bacterium]MBF0526797.1 DUF2442 domain-containing protein [Deltaproteobacteria bacterium]